MKEVIFWKDWERPYKIAVNFLMIIFLFSLVFLIVGLIKGEDFVIHWQVLNLKEPITVTFESFSKGFFNFNIVADNFIIFQKFQGSQLQVNITGNYIFGLMLGVSLVFYLATVTDLSRFWYIVAMGVFIIFMVNLKLEHLQIFGRIERIPLIVIFVIVLAFSYYFHAISSGTFWRRVLIFTFVIIGCCIGIYYTAAVSNPFLYITNYGVLGFLIVTCAFILMISHEIISAFIYFLTSTTTTQSKNTMRHFLIITGFYLANVTLLYLYETKIIAWDFYYINPYVLFILSGVIGFWGLITRSGIFSNAVPFYPWGPILYLSIGTIALGTTGFLFVTGNDPILEVVKDTIIYGHLGFGGIFLIYILANFGALIGKNVQVYKVIYKPKTMPYFTFRFAGLIATAAFFLKENIEVPIYHSLSGYYNGIGDLYTANREYYVAEQYYKLGSDYGYQNHRSNYALASLASKQGDLSATSYFYDLAINKRPTEYAIVNLGNTLIDDDQFLNGLFVLTDGLEEFPRSGPIMINTGLAFRKTDILDSAALLFDQASNYEVSERLGKNNFLALVCENNWALDPDSLREEYFMEGNDVAPVNFSVFLNLNNQFGNYVPAFPVDSILGSISSAAMVNQAMNSIMHGESTFIPVLDSLRRKVENYRYAEELEFMLALGYYNNGRIDKSFSILRGLAANNYTRSGFYFNTMGLIALKENAWEAAAQNFDMAFHRRFSQGLLNRAIALSEAGNLEGAEESWTQWQEINRQDPSPAAMLEVLTMSVDELAASEDPVKYQFLRYRKNELSEEQQSQVLASFEDPVYYESLILDEAHELLQNMEFEKANQLLTNTIISNEGLRDEYILLLLSSRSVQEFELSEEEQSLINSDIRGNLSTLKAYLRAMNAAKTNDTLVAAVEFEKIGFGNPFFLPGVINAIEYFKEAQPDDIISYSILVEAVQYNETSVTLWKAYVEECVRRGYDNYAEHGLEVLSFMLDESSLVEFTREYNQWKENYDQPEFNQ